MGQAFDIIYKPPKKNYTESKTVNKSTNTNGAWLFMGLVVIIFFMLADMSNSFKNKTDNNKPNDTNLNSNEKVLGESTVDKTATETSTNEPINTNIDSTPKTAEDNVIEKSDNLIVEEPQTNEINKSEIKIRVLNGSKVSGTAARVKNILTQAGFNIDSTGDAKNIYNNTVIYYNTDQEKAAIMIQLALNNQGATIQKNSSLTGDYDILVVAGKDYVD